MKHFSQTKIFMSVLMAGIVLFSSCASTTLITSEPSDADVYVNGEYLGKTPATYSDERIIFSDVSVRLKKEGYEEHYDFFARNEEPNVGVIIGAIIFWPFWLWALDYKPEHHYKLTPEEE